MTNDGLGKRLFEKMLYTLVTSAPSKVFWTLTQTTQTFECFSVFVHIHYIAMRVSFQFNTIAVQLLCVSLLHNYCSTDEFMLKVRHALT